MGTCLSPQLTITCIFSPPSTVWTKHRLPPKPKRTLQNSIIYSFCSASPGLTCGGGEGRRVGTPGGAGRQHASLSGGLEDACGLSPDHPGFQRLLTKRTRVPRLSHFAGASLIGDLAVPPALPLPSVTFSQVTNCAGWKALPGRRLARLMSLAASAHQQQSSAVNHNHSTTDQREKAEQKRGRITSVQQPTTRGRQRCSPVSKRHFGGR